MVSHISATAIQVAMESLVPHLRSHFLWLAPWPCSGARMKQYPTKMGKILNTQLAIDSDMSYMLALPKNDSLSSTGNLFLSIYSILVY